MLLSLFANCSRRSLKRSNFEQIAPFVVYKRVTVSNSLRSLMTKEWWEQFALFHEQISLSFIRSQKTSDSLENLMSKFPTLLKRKKKNVVLNLRIFYKVFPITVCVNLQTITIQWRAVIGFNSFFICNFYSPSEPFSFNAFLEMFWPQGFILLVTKYTQLHSWHRDSRDEGGDNFIFV